MDQGSSPGALGLAAERSLSNRSVERASRLLSVFSLSEPWLSLSELARRAELPKATAHRLAAALRSCGLLIQAPDGRYGLGIRLLELGAVVRENLDAHQLSRGAIEAIAAATGETVLLVIVDWPAREILLVARRDSPHPLSVLQPVGLRQPIPLVGAFAKALLSRLPPPELEEIVNELTRNPSMPRMIEPRLLLRQVALARQNGYASEQDQYFDGVTGVAVPVIYDGDRPLAALGVVGPTSRLAEKIPSLGAVLIRETAMLRPTERPETLPSKA